MGSRLVRVQTLEEVLDLVCRAIAGKWLLAGSYLGCWRPLCPHMLGRSSGGQLRLLCYQFGGESRSGLAPLGSSANWRCLVLEKLLELEEGPWHTGATHSHQRTCIEHVELDVNDHPEREPQNGQ